MGIVKTGKIQSMGDPLGERYVKSLWFEQINSGASGTLTPPSQGEIVLDQWSAGVDALASTIASGIPAFVSPVTSGGVIITATLDASGNWTLSGTPSSYPIAIVYVYQIKFKFFDYTKQLGGYELIPSAGGVFADVAGFGGKLSSADTTVQKALDTLDDHVHSDAEDIPDLPQYLKLDQTTPQTILVDSPHMFDGYQPLHDYDLASKLYVDEMIPIATSLFFYKEVMADYASCYKMQLAESTNTLQTISYSGVINDQALTCYITNINKPNLDTISEGTHRVYIRARKDNSGSKDLRIYWKLFKINAALTTETLLMTSGSSNLIPTDTINIFIVPYYNAEVSLLTTDRLILRVYANVSGGGVDPDVSFFVEGNSDARYEMPISIAGMSNLFLPYQNAKFDVDLGTKTLKTAGLTVGSLAGVLKATTGVVSGSAIHADLGSIGESDHHTKFTTTEHSAIGNSAPHHAQGTDTDLGTVGTKNPPIDADLALYRDSAASNVLVTSTWTQVKAFLKTYFDNLYNLYVHPNHSGEVTSSADGAQTIANKQTMSATAPITLSNTPTVIGAAAPVIAIPAATASINGYATSTQITKLDGIEPSAVALTTVKGDADVASAISLKHAAITLAVSADVLLGLSTQELSLDTQTANLGFFGPVSGAAAAPTFRAMVGADLGTNLAPFFDQVTAGSFNLNNEAGTNRALRVNTLGVYRWLFGGTGDPETGGNAGSNFQMYRYADNGNYLGVPLTVLRSSGNVGIGDPAPGELLDVAGNINATGVLKIDDVERMSATCVTIAQVAFPATQVPSTDVNTLDDYEEGTWTPGLTFGGGTTGMTFTAQAGYYTKIGNIVTITGYFLLSGKGSSTGSAVITGLPFTVVNNNAGYTAVALSISAITFDGKFQCFCVPNTTTMYVQYVTSGSTPTQVTNAHFANTSYIMMSCTYRVA